MRDGRGREAEVALATTTIHSLRLAEPEGRGMDY
jgi:hypothetical protein